MAVLMGACAEGALLTLLQLPGAASPAWLPALAGVWGLLLPVALLLQAPLPPARLRSSPLAAHTGRGRCPSASLLPPGCPADVAW